MREPNWSFNVQHICICVCETCINILFRSRLQGLSLFRRTEKNANCKKVRAKRRNRKGSPPMDSSTLYAVLLLVRCLWANGSKTRKYAFRLPDRNQYRKFVAALRFCISTDKVLKIHKEKRKPSCHCRKIERKAYNICWKMFSKLLRAPIRHHCAGYLFWII